MHADVDIKKRPSCGVGPGLAFSCEYNSLTGRRVGLVPCAIGGSSLRQWMPDYAPTAEELDQLYWRQDENLFQSMISRAQCAVSCLPDSAHRIKGLLFYHGETDALSPDSASTYHESLRRMIEAVRQQLGDPALPVLVVQVSCVELPAGYNGRASHNTYPGLDAVRMAQLGVSESLPRVCTVDAWGLPLSARDGIHLTAHAQLELGSRMAHALARMIDCESAPDGATSPDPLASLESLMARVYQRVSEFRETEEMQRVAAPFPIVAQRKRKLVRRCVSRDSPSFPLLLPRDQVNFVYGEIAPRSVSDILRIVRPQPGEVAHSRRRAIA
jgi:hypothetical protein